MPRRRRRELVESDEFHAEVVRLLRVTHADWTWWEREWLQTQAQRPSDYVFSEGQRLKLKELTRFSKTVTSFGGYTVPELIAIAYPCRFDVSEEDEDLLNKLHAWNATDVKIRQAWTLAAICRPFGYIIDEAA